MSARNFVRANRLCFHGSDVRFDALYQDATRYEDDGVCLSASPLVAAAYGKHIYVVECRNVALMKISLRSWFGMSDDHVAELKTTPLDGVWITREPAAAGFTFLADTVILWSFHKCVIRDVLLLESSISANKARSLLKRGNVRDMRLRRSNLSCENQIGGAARLLAKKMRLPVVRNGARGSLNSSLHSK